MLTAAHPIRCLVVLLALLVGFGLAACGGSGGDGAQAPAPPAAPSGPLTGAAGSPAKAAIQTVDVGDSYTPDEISVTPAGAEIIRTKLEIVFRPEATVGQVNTLLTDLNAVITTSIAGLEGVVVRIPDPGTLGALDAIVTRIGTEPFVWFVSRAILPTAEALPGNIPPAPDAGIAVRHHLAVGGAGAWNARGAIVDSARVVIWDYFGDGAPNGDLDYAYDGDPAADFATGAPNDHGYHVAGIIAGRFGGPETLRGWVTGMVPGVIQLSVIDGRKSDPLDGRLRLLVRLQALEDGTALVNISQGVSALCTVPVTCQPDAVWRAEGAWWVQAIRTLGLENRVLILKSAGNINDNGNDDARYNRFEATAALSPDLLDGSGNPLPPLTNTLVVENVSPLVDFPYEGPRCQSSSSWRGGNVGAIGTEVWSLTNAGTTAAYLSGTSMATPQVAGLAAYLLAIRPQLSPQELKAILLETAATVPTEINPDCSDWPSPAPMIQAYPALLALDRPNQGAAQAPVRRAILDINDSGSFTGDDIVAFLLAYETAQGELDLGRADLNNDGRTGGDTARSFDLDLDRFHATTGVTRPILGEIRSFDETSLTDVGILCYYAYSTLYAGSAEARDMLLQPYRELGQCGVVPEFSVNASMPDRMMVGVPESLVVRVTNADGPVVGASIVVSAEGGSATGGNTDANGVMEGSASIAMDSSILTVTIQAFVGDELVGEIVEQAQAALPATAGMFREGFKWSNVTGATNVNLAGGYALRPPGETLTNENNGNTFTYAWDNGGIPLDSPDRALRMHRFTGYGSGNITVTLYVMGADGLDMTMDFPAGLFRVDYHADGSPDSVPEYVASNYTILCCSPPVEIPPLGNPGTIAMEPGLYVVRAFSSPALGVVFTRDPAAPQE